MKERLKRVLPLVGYGSFYLLVFFFACYLTFPYNKLKDRLLAEFVAQQKPGAGQQRLEIEELEPYWFTGWRVRGLRFTMVAPPKPGDTEESSQTLEIEELRARLGIFARLIGKNKLTFFARAFGGEIEGVFVDASTERHIELEMRDLSAGRVDMLQSLVGLPIKGSMKGKVDLTFPDKRASKGEGVIQLAVSDLAVGDGVTKLKGSIALPRMDVGELVLDADAKEGTLKVNKFEGKGKDLELASDGIIKLRDVPTESSVDLYLRFKFTDAYRGRNDVTKSLLGAPGSSAPALFELADPKIKQAKRPDGFYGWHMMGAINAPKFEPFAGTPPPPRGAAGPTSPALRGFTK